MSDGRVQLCKRIPDMHLLFCVCFREFVRALVCACMQCARVCVCVCVCVSVCEGLKMSTLGCVSTHNRKHHQRVIIYTEAERKKLAQDWKKKRNSLRRHVPICSVFLWLHQHEKKDLKKTQRERERQGVFVC